MKSTWATVERVYHAALERPAVERAAFLSDACGGDAELQRDVESLLAQASAAIEFLDGPAVEAAAQLMTDEHGTLIGRQIGVYRVVSVLGAGGMGDVYRARDTKLGRDVAIKVLPAMFTADRDRLARFEREARMLATLNHLHIGAIYGLEESAGVRALVLELVDGETLAEKLAGSRLPASGSGHDQARGPTSEVRSPLSISEAIAIARQIAEALEAAHEKGIIHRDLKPANIKITPDGIVKVLDFGLAKAASGDGSTPDLTQLPTVTVGGTREGIVLGTPAYMSPEQARGHVVDRRTDIWAFGCVLYEMLTGKRAFNGDDVSDTLATVLKNDPDWNELPAPTPVVIRRLLRRCLDKDRKRRLESAADARLEIDDALTAPSAAEGAAAPLATLPRPLWKRALPVVTAVVASAIAAAVGFYARPSPTPPSVTRFSFALGDGQQFTNPGRQLLAISPDGTQMVYVANQRLWLRSMSDANARAIPGTEIPQGVANPVFSPDGRSLAFWSAADQTLKRIAVSGGTPVTLCPASGSYGMSWGPDGIVFYQFGQDLGSSIMRVSPNGGKPESLIGLKNGELADGPQMLPGGQALLFTIGTGPGTDRWDKTQIVVQSLTSSERKTLIENGSDARYLPTGHIVYALGGVLYAVPFDLKRLQVTAGPVPILEGIRRAGGATGTAQFSVADGGSLMFIPGPVSPVRVNAQLDLALFDEKGGTQTLKLPPGTYTSPRMSPDGKYVAFGNDDGKEVSVWIDELSGASSMRRLTFGGRNQYPIWSPDGQRVAFNSDREGDRAIFWQKADGTDTAERLTRAEQGTTQVPQSWSPDGKQLLFEAVKGSVNSLWTFSLQDRKSTLIAGEQSSFPLDSMFSPDGRWIAYSSDQTGAPQVYVQPFPSTGAKYQITKNLGLKPVWSPDGKQLFYVPGNGQFAVVTIATQPSFTVGNPEPLPRGWADLFTSPRVYDILPDGKRFIAVVPAGETPSGAATAPQIINVVLNWQEELKRLVPTR